MSTLSPSLFTEVGTVRLVELGKSLTQDSTGRIWKFSKADSTEIARGVMTVSADQDSERDNLSFAVAPAVGDKSVKITVGTGSDSANDYRDGWMVVQDGAGEGRAYPIEGHGAITASVSNTYDLKEPIDTAGALAETGVDLLKNRYADIVIGPGSDNLDVPTGVPSVVIPASNYGYVQVWGPCSVWQDETSGVGAMLSTGDETAGTVDTLAAGDPLIGHQGPQGGVETEYQLAYLMIDR
ncbi:hypothetical protein LCGC14_0995800 [marine sediment metagenome]|uniref:Uncharacterized protein n=1 Tax=marine sediment metagenome TaxID=412755 RepID=A0A0F9RAQ9_9ZZZZ